MKRLITFLKEDQGIFDQITNYFLPQQNPSPVKQKLKAKPQKSMWDLSAGPQPGMDTSYKETEEFKAAEDLMRAIQSGASQGQRNVLANVARQETSKRVASSYDTTPEKLGTASAPDPNKRISGVYWVTNKDFFDATGELYNPRSAEHKRVFFDLVGKGESTRHPLSRADEFVSATMRRRPSSGIPKYGTPEAFYDREVGSLIQTTPESRKRAARPTKEMMPGAGEPSVEDIAKELGVNRDELLRSSDYAKKMYDKQHNIVDTSNIGSVNLKDLYGKKQKGKVNLSSSLPVYSQKYMSNLFRL